MLAILAALANNFGVNLQKLAWTKKQSNVIRGSVYRTYWLLGMMCIVLASIFDIVALAFGPQSVIAPLGSFTILANAFIAPKMHGEKLHPGVIKASAIIIVGCTTAVAAASHSNNICDVDTLFAMYFTSRFFVYMLVIGSIILGIIFFARRAETLKGELGEDSAAYQSVFRYHRISYAAVSGIFGAQSVLFARTVDLLFVGSTRRGRIFLAYPGTYMVLFSLVACIFLQLYWLNQGLARFESLYNVPIFTTTWIVGTVIAGGVIYQEFSEFSVAQAILFPLGVILCCVGVFLLSQGAEEEQSGLGAARVASDEELGADDISEHGVDKTVEDSRKVDLLGFPHKKGPVPLVF